MLIFSCLKTGSLLYLLVFLLCVLQLKQLFVVVSTNCFYLAGLYSDKVWEQHDYDYDYDYDYPPIHVHVYLL